MNNIERLAAGLVTDRTPEDVAHVSEIASRITNGTASAEEIAEFNSGALKGAYNASDMNRVGEMYATLYSTFAGYGYQIAGYNPMRIDWEKTAIPSKAELESYLESVKAFREQFSIDAKLPESMNRLDVKGANQIEQLAFTIIKVLYSIENSLIYSGEAFSGEF